jgi:hypothetical protein
MKNRSFPAWAGPVVAPVVCAILAVQVHFRFARMDPRPPPGTPVQWGLGGAAAGFALGLLIWLLDRPSSPPAGLGVEERCPEARRQESSLLSRFLALLAVLLCCVPFVGLGLSLLALFLNWNSFGWARTCSRVGLVLSSLSLSLFLLVLWSG